MITTICQNIDIVSYRVTTKTQAETAFFGASKKITKLYVGENGIKYCRLGHLSDAEVKEWAERIVKLEGIDKDGLTEKERAWLFFSATN